MEQLKKLLMILCLSAFIFTAGCNKDDKPNDPTNTGGAGGWEFLKLGNQWKYEMQTYDKDSNVIGNSTIHVLEITKIEKNDSIPDIYEITINDDDIWIWCANDKGFYENKYYVDENYPIIYKNCYVGQKWTYTFPDGDKLTREILSINETVKTPAGTFTGCVRIRETASWLKKTYIDNYLSPIYGIIMEDDYDEEDERRHVVQLISKNF